MGIEVRQPEPHNVHAMKHIWKSCFDDTQEYIDMFFETAYTPQNALVAFYDLKPVGMLFLLPARLYFDDRKFDGRYIYAASVSPEYRKKGIMRELEKAAQQFVKSQKADFISLIPQTDGLYKMYEKLGYKTAFYQGLKTYMPFRSEKVAGARIDACSKEDFILMRHNFMKTKPFILDLRPPYDDYRFVEMKKSGTDIISVLFEEQKYYIVGYKRGLNFVIKETNLCEETLCKLLPMLAKEYSVEFIRTRGVPGRVDEIVPYGMYKSFNEEIDINTIKGNHTYMNLMLD
ncbi:MAG: GNAT family N-acetyltransferase [Oscillospiraceae bacterium]